MFPLLQENSRIWFKNKKGLEMYLFSFRPFLFSFQLKKEVIASFLFTCRLCSWVVVCCMILAFPSCSANEGSSDICVAAGNGTGKGVMPMWSDIVTAFAVVLFNSAIPLLFGHIYKRICGHKRGKAKPTSRKAKK